VQAAREQLDRAVARAMRSAGRCRAQQRGLDSSGVAATAARLTAPTPSPYIHACAAGLHRTETDRKYFSERPKVEALGRMIPT